MLISTTLYVTTNCSFSRLFAPHQLFVKQTDLAFHLEYRSVQIKLSCFRMSKVQIQSVDKMNFMII